METVAICVGEETAGSDYKGKWFVSLVGFTTMSQGLRRYKDRTLGHYDSRDYALTVADIASRGRDDRPTVFIATDGIDIDLHGNTLDDNQRLIQHCAAMSKAFMEDSCRRANESLRELPHHLKKAIGRAESELEGEPSDLKDVVEQVHGERKKYTVVLLYPEYMTDNYGVDTFMTHVEAQFPADAIVLAREEVANIVNPSDDDPIVDTADLYCIACIEGEHYDLS